MRERERERERKKERQEEEMSWPIDVSALHEMTTRHLHHKTTITHSAKCENISMLQKNKRFKEILTNDSHRGTFLASKWAQLTFGGTQKFIH